MEGRAEKVTRAGPDLVPFLDGQPSRISGMDSLLGRQLLLSSFSSNL